MISAYAVDSGLVLAQQAVPDDTNEIGAMPELLKILGLQGSIVTVDAANCQIENAKIILKQGGDYVFALKGNQGTLHDQVREMFEGQAELKAGSQASISTIETREQGHGRSEWRHYTMLYDKDFLDYLNQNEHGDRPRLADQKCHSRRTQTPDRGQARTQGALLHLKSAWSSRPTSSPTAFARIGASRTALTGFWMSPFMKIIHACVPDLALRTWLALRHMALNFLKSEKSVKKSINRKRFAAALDPDYLLKILRAGSGSVPALKSQMRSPYKLLYLALTNAAEEWTMPIRDWKPALQQFAILFEGRVPRADFMLPSTLFLKLSKPKPDAGQMFHRLSSSAMARLGYWNLATNDYACAAHVVDWYHAKQHLWAAADLIYPHPQQPDKAAAAAWVEQHAAVLYAGKALEIADALLLLAALANAETKAKLETEAGYFATNHERMQYHDFQQALLPIGSGTVESGAKQAKHRLAAAGMRWSRTGLETSCPFAPPS